MKEGKVPACFKTFCRVVFVWGLFFCFVWFLFGWFFVDFLGFFCFVFGEVVCLWEFLLRVGGGKVEFLFNYH